MHYFTRFSGKGAVGGGIAPPKTPNPLERGTPPPQNSPQGAYGALTPRFWRGLDAFGAAPTRRRLGAFVAAVSSPITFFFIRPLIRTVKMETRHPVEESFGSEFPAICNHCVVVVA